MNKFNTQNVVQVMDDLLEILSRHGIRSGEVIDGDRPGSLRVKRGKRHLDWGVEQDENGQQVFTFGTIYRAAISAWFIEVDFDGVWSASCPANAPPGIVDYFRSHNPESARTGFKITLPKYEDGLALLDLIVADFAGGQLEKVIRTILNQHGIGTGRRIAVRHAKGWQVCRESLYLSWGYLAKDRLGVVDSNCYVLCLSRKDNDFDRSACLAQLIFRRDPVTSVTSVTAYCDPDNSRTFGAFMKDLTPAEIDMRYRDGHAVRLSSSEVGLRLVDGLVAMFAEYERPQPPQLVT